MKLLIKKGRVIDSANHIDRILDILIEGGKISQINADIKSGVDKIIDAQDKIVMPGIVDMHAHLREPGREDKETIATGTNAGLKGGVTSVLAMPNTEPAMDSPENVKLLKSIIQNCAQANVFMAGAITQGRQGKTLTDIVKLKKQGVIAITDDGVSVDSDELFFQALKIAKDQKILVICHSEDKALSHKGVVNLGFISTRLGLRGIPKEAEYKRVERDIQLAQKTKAKMHIAHISCKESVEMVADAKKKGISVTAETAPHYFSLTEEATLGYDTNAKMNPPLRNKEDVEAIKQGLKNGVIDVIASDHAPHTESEKEIEFEQAAFGAIGLETELAVSILELVQPGILDWPNLVKKLCLNPAKILGINKGTLSIGADADMVIVSPDKEWQVTKESFVSKSKNSCFLGKKLKGMVEYTICGGRIAYKL